MNEWDFEPDDVPNYRATASIDSGELSASLRRLQFFDSDMFLRTQAINLDIVDHFVMQLEDRVREELDRKSVV